MPHNNYPLDILMTKVASKRRKNLRFHSSMSSLAPQALGLSKVIGVQLLELTCMSSIYSVLWGSFIWADRYDSGDTLMESPEPPTIKPDAATKSKSTKPDAATKSKSTKPDAATKSTKPDAATKSPKPDAATKSPKPDGATKFTKPEATKSDVVTKSDEKKSNTKSDDGTAGGVAKSDSGAELQLLEKLLVGIRVQTSKSPEEELSSIIINLMIIPETTFKLNLFGDDDDDNDDNISSK